VSPLKKFPDGKNMSQSGNGLNSLHMCQNHSLEHPF